MSYLTYQDLVEHALDYLGLDTGGLAERIARNAARSAMRDVAKSHLWSYYLFRGRIATVAPYSTGTVAFDLTGGTYERQWTLSSGTWPDWAGRGVLRVSTLDYQVEERKSSTIITTTSVSSPAADIASGTSYSIYQDSYPLPTDFQAMGELMLAGQARGLAMVTNQDYVLSGRHTVGPALPSCYAIGGDPSSLGGMVLRFFPAPDAAYAAEFVYQRRPRDLFFNSVNAGTASTIASSTTVTGSGTAWTSAMIGSIIRLSDSSQDAPAGPGGTYPYHEEGRIASVSSTTSLTLTSSATYTATGVKYQISDPADVEAGAMTTLLLRELERQCRLLRRIKATPEEAAAYEIARIHAQEADSRSFAARAAGRWPGTMIDYRNMPMSSD